MSTCTRAPNTGRPYSTRELQDAAAALAAGRFAHTRPHRGDPSGRTGQASAAEAPWSVANAPSAAGASGVVEETGEGTLDAVVAGLEPLVRVRAGNAGAGASTIALALADAADAAGVRTRVLDAAAPAWSGLLGATATELGAAQGWRRGRRGTSVLIDRVEERVMVPSAVPVPGPSEGVDLTVLDVGWSMRELAAADHPQFRTWLAATPARVEVLVTRTDRLALSQTEAALTGLEEQLAAERVVVVAVGAGRFSDRAFATAGPLLRRVHGQGAVLFAPLLTAKALSGLGPGPLPKRLRGPGEALLARITTITRPLPEKPGLDAGRSHR